MRVLKERVKLFEEASGISLSTTWNVRDIGAIVKLANDRALDARIHMLERAGELAGELAERAKQSVHELRGIESKFQG